MTPPPPLLLWALIGSPPPTLIGPQVCSYRSSFYSDVLHHFRCYHSGRRQLLCILCLKVTNNIKGFQNHMDKHKVFSPGESRLC